MIEHVPNVSPAEPRHPPRVSLASRCIRGCKDWDLAGHSTTTYRKTSRCEVDTSTYLASALFLHFSATRSSTAALRYRETSKMSEDRLWKFRKPEWLKSVHARNAGIYSAGALVRSPSPLS
jgi:hypothetical protein